MFSSRHSVISILCTMTLILNGKYNTVEQISAYFAFVYLYVAYLEVKHVYQSEEINRKIIFGRK